MATQKPISTISYNTEAFLKEKLEEWVKAHIIQAYCYICHKGEDGDKDHIHLRIEPNKKLDPMDLTEKLQEFQIGKDKPLGVRTWRPSKEEDWFLYAVHDKHYLQIKYGGGEKGEKLPYSWQDIKANENYDVEVAWTRARIHMQHSTANIATRMQQGDNPLSLVLEGENPYLVNAVMRTLAQNDYQRLADELEKTNAKLHSLIDSIYAYGLSVEVTDQELLKLCPPPSDPVQ